MPTYINKDNPVYISYAWGEDLEIDVNKICVLMETNGIFFKRDKAKGENSQCPYRYNIITAEEEIGRGKAIIVVISDKYIKSLNCMYEWHCICKTGNITKRVFPIVLPGTKLKQDYRYNSFKKLFEERLQNISDREVMSNIEAKERKCLENDGYIKDLETLRNYIKENNIPDLESLREDDYQIIIEQLKEHVKNIEDEERKDAPTPTSAPFFKLPIQTNLVQRDYFVKQLHDLVSSNNFCNLYGFGGSGKTSLTYLFLKEYRSDYNQIAYIVVNNNIKADIISQINDTIHIFNYEMEKRNPGKADFISQINDTIHIFNPGEDIVDNLRSWYKDSYRERNTPNFLSLLIGQNNNFGAQNLMILDNNTADGDVYNFMGNEEKKISPSNMIADSEKALIAYEYKDATERKQEKNDKYMTIIQYLETNYKSDKPNLLIIDINNAPEGDATKFGEELANNTLSSNKIYPDGWKVLIISRGSVYEGLAKLNLNENESIIENTIFLKALFLKNAGNKYNNFSDNDFANLFETICYSPLLAEQLGKYLQFLPQKSVSQIRVILQKKYFIDGKLSGVVVQNRSSNEDTSIIGFLKNIIKFDKIEDLKQKELLRHFILWPADFISRNIIYGLLKGVFTEEDELDAALINLVRHSIIVVQEVDGDSQYKLHGLIAESLRNQITISQ